MTRAEAEKPDPQTRSSNESCERLPRHSGCTEDDEGKSHASDGTTKNQKSQPRFMPSEPHPLRGLCLGGNLLRNVVRCHRQRRLGTPFPER